MRLSYTALLLLSLAVVAQAAPAMGMMGGWSARDADDEDVKRVFDFALSEVNKRINSIYKHDLLQIEAAEVQVVAGMNYKIVATTTKGDPQVDRATHPRYTVSVQLYEVPWEQRLELTKFNVEKKEE